MVAQLYVLKTTKLNTLKGQIFCESYLNKPVIKVFQKNHVDCNVNAINQKCIIKLNSDQDSSENVEYDSVCYWLNIRKYDCFAQVAKNNSANYKMDDEYLKIGLYWASNVFISIHLYSFVYYECVHI